MRALKAWTHLILLAAGLSVATQQAMGRAEPTETTLMGSLRTAIRSSPRLKSAQFREEALREEIRAQKSAYLPEVDAAAVASQGDPGSFALFGVDNNFSSSQRIGAGGALIVKQSLYDFGRTASSVRVAEAQESLQRKRRSIFKAEIARDVLRTYIQCSFLKAEAVDSRFMAEQAEVIAREVNRFVRSGQRSIIERYLVDAAAKEAETRSAELAARVAVTEKRLAIEMGLPAGTATACSPLAVVEAGIQELERRSGPNPFLEEQRAQIATASSRLERAKAEARPLLLGVATGGYWASDRVPNDKPNYSAGIGISVPLFSGFRIESNVGRETADLRAEETTLAHRQQSLDAAGSRFEEETGALGVRLEFLRSEKTLAKSAFDLARKRYLGFQGTMIDLRETMRNLGRVLDSASLAYHDLFAARGEKALVIDGAEITE